MKNKIILWIIVSLFLFSNVFAIGLSPAKKTIVYESGVKEFDFLLK